MKRRQDVGTEQTGHSVGAGGKSWTNETLPLKVRRELLSRELKEVISGGQANDAEAGRSSQDERLK